MPPNDSDKPTTTWIPGRPVVDLPNGPFLTTGYVEDDDEDDEFDDAAILEQLRERLKSQAGPQWTEIAATHESVTVALEVQNAMRTLVKGSLVRVITWDSDGIEDSETLWLPEIRLDDLLATTATEPST